MEYDGERYNDEYTEELELGEWDIPPLELECRGEKGVAEFRSLEDLSARDIKRLRASVGDKAGGAATNSFYTEALSTLVTRWDIPTKPNLAIPKGPNVKLLDEVPGVVLRQMERHIRPFLDRLMEEDQGDPTSPASA